MDGFISLFSVPLAIHFRGIGWDPTCNKQPGNITVIRFMMVFLHSITKMKDLHEIVQNLIKANGLSKTHFLNNYYTANESDINSKSTGWSIPLIWKRTRAEPKLTTAEPTNHNLSSHTDAPIPHLISIIISLGLGRCNKILYGFRLLTRTGEHREWKIEINNRCSLESSMHHYSTFVNISNWSYWETTIWLYS